MGKPEKSSALAVFPSLITQYRISDVLFNSVVHGSRGLQFCGPCTHDVLVFFFLPPPAEVVLFLGSPCSPLQDKVVDHSLAVGGVACN